MTQQGNSILKIEGMDPTETSPHRSTRLYSVISQKALILTNCISENAWRTQGRLHAFRVSQRSCRIIVANLHTRQLWENIPHCASWSRLERPSSSWRGLGERIHNERYLRVTEPFFITHQTPLTLILLTWRIW